jgi:hypothetical protein
MIFMQVTDVPKVDSIKKGMIKMLPGFWDTAVKKIGIFGGSALII